MRTQFAKIALAVLGFAITIFLACSDYSTLNFPSQVEVNQRYSGLSSSGGVTVCDDADKCNGVCYNRETEFCRNLTIYKMCIGNPYDVQLNICCGNDLYKKSEYGCCNETSYLLLNKGCINNKILTKCGTEYYDPLKQFCTENKQVLTLCGGMSFNPPGESCINGTVQGTCGGNLIDRSNFFCYGDEPFSLCGGEPYNPSTQFCSGTAFHDKCGDRPYEPSTQFCSGEDIYDFCGGLPYNPTSQLCSGTTIMNKCGDRPYDPLKEYCYNSQTYSCGDKPYNPATHFCDIATGQTYTCGNKPYNPATHFCNTAEGKAYSCGDKPYDNTKYYCDVATGQTHTCNNKPINPATQFCYGNSTVVNFCNTRKEEYDPSKYECKTGSNGIFLKGGITDTRDNKKYNAVLIGTQIWMAENMNYKTNYGVNGCGVIEYSANLYTNECDITTQYGRVYNWVAAMAIGNEYNSTKYNASNNHQGICPEGWHIPNSTEWETLIRTVEPSTTFGTEYYPSFRYISTKLKATSFSSGTDDYGFKALSVNPCEDRGESKFNCWSGESHWWSSYEKDNGNAYYLSMGGIQGANSYNDGWFDGHKTMLRSVRCLKNGGPFSFTNN